MWDRAGMSWSMTSHILNDSGTRTLCGLDLSTPEQKRKFQRVAYTLELAKRKGTLCKRCKSRKLADRRGQRD